MKTLRIAITGGIGSGKSAVINILNGLGYKTFSCDQISRELFEKPAVKRKLKKMFPKAVTGFLRLNVNRKKISDEVFADKNKLDKLNGLLHPMIIEQLLTEMANAKESAVFAEVPLLFEGQYERLFDKVIVILRSKEARVDSVVKRSALSKEEIERRIENQFDYSSLDKSKYLVIENDGDQNQLAENVKAILDKLTK